MELRGIGEAVLSSPKKGATGGKERQFRLVGMKYTIKKATIIITQRFGSCQPITNKWLPGDFWTPLAQCC